MKNTIAIVEQKKAKSNELQPLISAKDLIKPISYTISTFVITLILFTVISFSGHLLGINDGVQLNLRGVTLGVIFSYIVFLMTFLPILKTRLNSRKNK